MDTMVMAAMVAANVAIIQGIKISVGWADLNATRSAIIMVGINVSPEACRHKNISCALVALLLSGFSSCRLSMAFIPNGVAALSSPNRLAEKFITICPIDGCSRGTSGKIREKNGPMILDRNRIPPARSAIFIKPRNKAIIPIRLMQSCTASFVVSKTPLAGSKRKTR